MTLTCACVCVCVFVYNRVCVRMVLLFGFVSACLFIHLPIPSAYLSISLCASVLNLDSICRVFSVQGLFSSLLAWKVFLCLNQSASSVKPNYPKYCEIS